MYKCVTPVTSTGDGAALRFFKKCIGLRNSHSLLVGMQHGTAPLEEGVEN